jgi:hypothetical protein
MINRDVMMRDMVERDVIGRALLFFSIHHSPFTIHAFGG